MRVNVYGEEITDDIELIEPNEANDHHFGVRFYLKSHEALHANDLDDDRSAVTFWVKDRMEFYNLINPIARLFADYERVIFERA
jgi:hypothetical protein